MVEDCRNFIRRFEKDDRVICSLLFSYVGPIDEFLKLRRSIWPDMQFYHSDFSWQRMHIAVATACGLNNMWTAAPLCRSVLGLDNGAAQNHMHFSVSTETSDTLIHGLAMKIGMTNGTETAEEWRTILRDVLGYSTDIGILSHNGPRTYSDEALVSLTPFSMLITQSLLAEVGTCRKHVTIRPTDSAAVLADCEKAIFAWLDDLYVSRIDLQVYGENEKDHFLHQEVSRCEGYPLNGMTYSYLDSDHIYNVRLINFHYGRFPTDWKFWWSETSDEFAGDFWSLLESRDREAVRNVPGAWVD